MDLGKPGRTRRLGLRSCWGGGIGLAALQVLAMLFAGSVAHATDTPENALPSLQAQAESGNREARFRLGTLYYIGLGAEQDWAVAVDWLRKAADQGQPEAQCELAMIYQIGKDGVLQDYAQAVRLYSAAAKQGDGAAELGLASLYAAGVGVPQDNALATLHLSKASLDGFVIDEHNPPLIQLYRHFLLIATSMFPLPDDRMVP